MSAMTEPTSLYDIIGGQQRIREMVDRFYDLMDLEPEFALLRSVHGASLDNARDRLAWFLNGWMGGPDDYIDRFGHPRLRARHSAAGDSRSDRREPGGACARCGQSALLARSEQRRDHYRVDRGSARQGPAG